MRSFHALSLLTLVASVWAAPVENNPTATLDTRSEDAKCGGVLVLVARGTDSNAPGGTTIDPQYTSHPSPLSSIVAAATSAGGPGSTFTAIPYPAAGSPYKTSLKIGIETTQNIIKDHVAKCGNDAKIVVTGYSQGAQVMSSALAGGDNVDGLSTSLAKHIVAGAIIADPSRVYPSAVDFNGTADGHTSAKRDGCTFLRHKNTADEKALGKKFGNVLRSFCAKGDNICAEVAGCVGGGNAIHKMEPAIWYKKAIGFIKPLIKAAVA